MKKLIALILALVLALSCFAGCAAQESEEPAATDKEETAAPAEDAAEDAADESAEFDGEMTLALLTFLTGTGRETGDRQIYAAQMAADKINAEGGVNGAKLVVEPYDVGADQQTCINAAQLAANTEGISGMIGVFQSNYNIAYSDIVKEAGIPTMCLGNSYSVRDLNNPYMWIPRVCDDTTSEAVAKRAIENGFKNPCIMWMTNAAGQSCHDVIARVYEEEGLPIGLDIGFNVENETDYTPYVTQFLNSDCDSIIILSYSNQGAPEIITLLNQYGYDMTKVTGNTPLFSSDLTDMVGEMVNGISGVSEFSPLADRAATKAYVEAFDAYQDTFTAAWTDAVTYDAVLLLAEAARLAGANDPESINNGLAMIENYTDGALTDYNYNEDHCLGSTLLNTVFDGIEITFTDVYEVR